MDRYRVMDSHTPPKCYQTPLRNPKTATEQLSPQAKAARGRFWISRGGPGSRERRFSVEFSLFLLIPVGKWPFLTNLRRKKHIITNFSGKKTIFYEFHEKKKHIFTNYS